MCVGGKSQGLDIYNRRFQVDFSKSATTCPGVSPCATLLVMADKNDKRIVFYLDGKQRPPSWKRSPSQPIVRLAGWNRRIVS